jgi:hypothetical protein
MEMRYWICLAFLRKSWTSSSQFSVNGQQTRVGGYMVFFFLFLERERERETDD